jgi:hypothetical protein
VPRLRVNEPIRIALSGGTSRITAPAFAPSKNLRTVCWRWSSRRASRGSGSTPGRAARAATQNATAAVDEWALKLGARSPDPWLVGHVRGGTFALLDLRCPVAKRTHPSFSTLVREIEQLSMHSSERRCWTVRDEEAALYVHRFGHARVAASLAEIAASLGIELGSFRMRVATSKRSAAKAGSPTRRASRAMCSRAVDTSPRRNSARSRFPIPVSGARRALGVIRWPALRLLTGPHLAHCMLPARQA